MRKEIENWWKQGKDDLEKARILFENKKYDGTAFFCQQSVEKGLKALALKERNKIKKIHDLVELGKDVNLPQNFIDYCKELTLSYIYSRYPDIEREKDIKTISNRFLRYAEEILGWIEKKL
jgi:HEPN domain-containing protein